MHDAWPPPYTIKKHNRAKHVRFRVSRRRGLEITIPPRFNLKDLPQLVDQHQAWIIKQFTKCENDNEEILPNAIDMRAVNEYWHVFYEPCHKKLEMIQRPGKELILIGKQQPKIYQRQLLTWIKQQAKNHLEMLLKETSENIRLSYNTVTIRDQQTRWGSCTHDKAISLNFRLIFLPQHLARHVMIHELCHTQELNHSNKFWDLVACHDSQWQSHKKQLRSAATFVPAWLD